MFPQLEHSFSFSLVGAVESDIDWGALLRRSLGMIGGFSLRADESFSPMNAAFFERDRPTNR